MTTENDNNTNGQKTSNDLTAMIRRLSAKYGYEDAVGQFIPLRDFKVRWTRTYKWISVEVSDYFADAPDEVIESLLTTIFERITGNEDASYQQTVVSHLTTEQFVREKQPVYLRRTRGISKTTMGNLKDLGFSYQKLIRMGLVEEDPQVYIGWNILPSAQTVAKTSVIMKVIEISDLLDNEHVDDELLDYCLYSQLVRIKMGFPASTASRGDEYNELLDLYPNRYEMEAKLELMGMHI